jgi:hypothetical protein
MLTKNDKGWVIENFVTKGEFHTELNQVKSVISRVETKVDKILVQMDKFTGRVADLDQENKMGAITTARHTRHIEALARKTKVTLPD